VLSICIFLCSSLFIHNGGHLPLSTNLNIPLMPLHTTYALLSLTKDLADRSLWEESFLGHSLESLPYQQGYLHLHAKVK